jgi:hypothetical protein
MSSWDQVKSFHNSVQHLERCVISVMNYTWSFTIVKYIAFLSLLTRLFIKTYIYLIYHGPLVSEIKFMNYTLSQRLEIQINYYYYCLYNKIPRFPACWSSFLNKNYLQNLIFEDEKKKILFYPKRMNYFISTWRTASIRLGEK